MTERAIRRIEVSVIPGVAHARGWRTGEQTRIQLAVEALNSSRTLAL
jgi:hypothetical protein